MKETKKRCLSILSIVVLITLVFMPLASSTTIKNCKEQTSDDERIYESVSVSSFEKKSTCGGTLYGYTVEAFDTWGSSPVPFALVDAGIKKTISAYPMGYYRITGLPFDQQITITASKKGYNNDTLKYTFTEQKSTYYYCFDLQENEDDSVKEKVSNKNDIGRIYGTVFGEVGGFQKYIPFASIELVGIEKKRCGIQGGYKFKGLALGQKYTLIAEAHGYYSRTERVTLTKENPKECRYFYLEQDPGEGVLEKSNLLDKTLTSKITENNGRIYGYTVSSYCWSWNPISNVLVTTGLKGKSTISKGYYSISGLPLNIPIRVTARKIGYYSDSKTITLTVVKPEKYLILDIQPFMGKTKTKNMGLISDLFSLIPLGSNTWSDFFGAFSFFV